MAVKTTAAQTKQPKQDSRIHSVVYHKTDSRVNEIIRRHRKSEIINLFGIDCCMLFRVGQAHMQFDMMQNYRPYILFGGNAEGVFLPAKMGLLFPNACDQLDFRQDKEVPVQLTYALSDLEIATLANNGLFNGDWSCQGRILNSVLEIPCKADYYAVANTPITFVEIQDRLSMHTSTLQTGYKTLVSAFLPYSAQKHNLERVATLVTAKKFEPEQSEIRKRKAREVDPAGFGIGEDGRTMADGASFVEVAQARIKQRLAEQMQKGDVLGVSEKDASKDGAKIAEQVAGTVAAIREQSEAARKKAIQESENSGVKLHAADLDAKLNDMAQRMVYAGAEAIPVEVPKLKAEPLVSRQPDPEKIGGLRPETQCEPVAAPDQVRDADDKIHAAAMGADKTAADIADGVKKAMSRKDKLAARRAEKAAKEAGEAAAKEPVKPAADAGGAGQPGLEDDVLSGNVDITALLGRF